VLDGGVDQFTLAVELGLGRRPAVPTRNGLVGTLFYVSVLPREGQTPDDLIDWELATELEHSSPTASVGWWLEGGLFVGVAQAIWEWKVADRYEAFSGESMKFGNGKRLGNMYVFSESYEENVQLGTALKKRLLKRHDLALWD